MYEIFNRNIEKKCKIITDGYSSYSEAVTDIESDHVMVNYS
ncbi:hypothetical protein H311_01650 [Anncaliia algerae PRA109]|nr:hypothetical protein H311_01650 [Anncaliia algerae PRA109]